MIPTACLWLCLLATPETEVPAHITASPGYVVERVAGPPLIERPMMASFDDRGRLFVCDSSGFNLTQGTSEDLVKNPPHLIRVLEDLDHDGRFDASRVFADKMTFPMGALYLDGALYVASPPYLWKLTEDPVTGVAAKREVFIAKFDFGGNSCDIHGPFLGPDGAIYWANCIREYRIPRKEGGELHGKASGVFRVRRDGAGVEMVCAGGMDNPVEIAFTDEGEAFATVDLLIGNPRPRVDGVIHCVEGGIFPYRPLGREYPRTGDVLPPMIDLGWVAPAGLTRARSNEQSPGVLYSAEFNTHRVTRHVLRREGATFRGYSDEFLRSSDPDFHPTDVIEDADGSLLIVDTGGWFLRGCPTSQIAKPQVTGAIYRLRKKDALPVQDARGLALDWSDVSPAELTRRLDDPRFVVRDRAVESLGHRGAKAVGALAQVLRDEKSPRARQNAIWGLTRIELPEAREAVRLAFDDPRDETRLTAVYSAGYWRDANAADRLRRMLVADPMPAIRREAATALGRMGDADAVPSLLAALRDGGERFLDHSQLYALIRIDDRDKTLPGLSDADPKVRRAALLALDQMTHGNLSRAEVLPFLESNDAESRRTALAIAMDHPEWSDGLAETLRAWLAESDLREDRKELLIATLVALSDQPAIQDVVAGAIGDSATPLASRSLLLEVIARARVPALPQAWIAKIIDILGGRDELLASQAVATARTRDEAAFDEALLALSRDSQVSPETRLGALAAVAPRLPNSSDDDFAYALAKLAPEEPALVRLAAAATLARLPSNEEQLGRLAEAFSAASPVERPNLLAAFERPGSARLGGRLLDGLNRASDLDGLTAESLRRTLQHYPESVQESATALARRLEGSLEEQTARLTELAGALSDGNPAQGRIVFYGAKASCAACHAVGGQGAAIGPDLSKIGAIRAPRDLLESIVFPSASLVRSYEPFQIETTAGKIHNGLLKYSTPDAVTLVTTERVEIRTPREDIAELLPSRLSIMPQGLDKQLTAEQLRDLIAYLVSLK